MRKIDEGIEALEAHLVAAKAAAARGDLRELADILLRIEITTDLMRKEIPRSERDDA